MNGQNGEKFRVYYVTKGSQLGKIYRTVSGCAMMYESTYWTCDGMGGER